MEQTRANIGSYEKRWGEEDERRQLEGDTRLYEIDRELNKACRENQPKELIYELFRKKRECEESTQEDLRNISRRWAAYNQRNETEMAYFGTFLEDGLTPRFWEGDDVLHAYPFAMNRPPLVCLQLRTPRIGYLFSGSFERPPVGSLPFGYLMKCLFLNVSSVYSLNRP
jgi:hypothetical protein